MQSLVTNAIYMTPFFGRWLFIIDNQSVEKVLEKADSRNINSTPLQKYYLRLVISDGKPIIENE
ncbi:hypothetical protein BJL74_04920 [Vibrio parahaemolyticus]|jgi:hypothetical protein|nr:hypothetical protein [Vibrio parahaemolyticus]OCH66581.1 hypothetical protein A6E00_11535 [Vibrio diabolicus]KOE76904.1 hypothetical protein ACS87_10385 [Vibrio parahaemolyticus]ODY94994.1 hypothetical protein BBM32_10800 [Vibrio parahaemolyticus]ODY96412.1 hypothetical protein BBM98_17445 [Vibrio parahaemolyticus]